MILETGILSFTFVVLASSTEAKAMEVLTTALGAIELSRGVFLEVVELGLAAAVAVATALASNSVHATVSPMAEIA